MSDVFSDTPTQETQTSLVDQLIGDGKRFRDVETLAKAKIDSDAFIEQMKREQAELRAELDRRVSVDDAIKNFQRNTAPATTPEVNTTPAEAQPLDEKTLIDRIRQVNQEMSAEQRQAANVNAAAAKLTETFGDATKANEVVKNKAAELGVSVKFLQDTAATSPQAFYNLLGLDKQASPTTQRTHSDVNPQSFGNQNPSGVKPGSYEYYEEIRKADPRKYFSPQVQNQLFQDAAEGRWVPKNDD